ncbi:MAG: hypothetical protein ABSD92_05180 [Candidatus Bathyarchaeia archaeon]|jgi:hypothetical protein
MAPEKWRITTSPSFLTEGLFGQIVLYVFEVLPKLYSNRVFPEWQITSLVYGFEPDFTVIPGVFDLSYTPNTHTTDVNLADLKANCVILGNQWETLHEIWTAYFNIPSRTVKRANAFGDLSHAIGLHYRGKDKNTDSKQTNPVSHDDFLTLINDFISNHEDIDTIFVASDEFPIKQAIKHNYKDKRVIDSGESVFWKDLEKTNNFAKADHAVLDCLLLSRCKYLIKNQSALSGFAKVLNPKIEAYRIAASKFLSALAPPYFPDGYIPLLTSEDPNCKAILNRLLDKDWTQNKKAMQKFGKPFATMPPSIWSHSFLMERLSFRWKIKNTAQRTWNKLHLEKARSALKKAF